ncbi:MAG: hypothetical protein IJ395_03460 [Clostridia bacterium]|nr:hypothetical protein [Clostridia bacterium]
MAEDVFTDEEGANHKTYGISAKDFNGHIFASFPDIFLNKQNAESLVNLCNESKLELCHLSDVIEDALT